MLIATDAAIPTAFTIEHIFHFNDSLQKILLALAAPNRML